MLFINLNKVFFGFTKDGKERCLYRKSYISQNNSLCINYFDLETNESFDFSEIAEKTLCPITDLIGVKKKNLKKSVVTSYKIDRDKKYELSRLFYSDIVRCVSKKEIKPERYTIWVGDTNPILVRERVLCTLGEGNFVQILSNNEQIPILENCKLVSNLIYYVTNFKPLKENHVEEEMTKKKILEMNYKNDL